jgi:flavin reductase (DIM6/NTAB) family NADH-FMN oxidoreductase RutF
MDPLFKLSYGLYILTSKDEVGRQSGCIINTAIQVTAIPEKISVTLSKNNFTTELVKDSGLFCFTVISERAKMDHIGKFGFRSGRGYDKFAGVPTALDINEIPYVTEDMVAVFSCKVIDTLDLDTHIMFIGQLVDKKILSDEPVMTYDYYHTVKKGKTGINAPSYKKEEHA